MAPPDDSRGSRDVSRAASASAAVPSIPTSSGHHYGTTPPLRCCCGREDCAFLQHSSNVLDSVEKDVHTAAKLGQVGSHPLFSLLCLFSFQISFPCPWMHVRIPVATRVPPRGPYLTPPHIPRSWPWAWPAESIGRGMCHVCLLYSFPEQVAGERRCPRKSFLPFELS